MDHSIIWGLRISIKRGCSNLEGLQFIFNGFSIKHLIKKGYVLTLRDDHNSQSFGFSFRFVRKIKKNEKKSYLTYGRRNDLKHQPL